MKGDRVEIVVAADDGSRTYEIVAPRAGRRVDVTTGRGIIEVTEVTRTGEPVRRARFMASRVLALVEHPASEIRAKGGTPADTAREHGGCACATATASIRIARSPESSDQAACARLARVLNRPRCPAEERACLLAG